MIVLAQGDGQAQTSGVAAGSVQLARSPPDKCSGWYLPPSLPPSLPHIHRCLSVIDYETFVCLNHTILS